jgi:hypothetical protein
MTEQDLDVDDDEAAPYTDFSLEDDDALIGLCSTAKYSSDDYDV